MSWMVAVLVAAVALVMALLAVAALRRSAPPEDADLGARAGVAA